MSVLRTDLGNIGNALALAAVGSAPINVAVGNDIGSGLPARGIKVKINVSQAPTGTTPGMVVTIQGVDKISNQKWTILASASITAQGFTVLTVYPGAAAVANVSANDCIPANLNINVAFTGTTPSFTGNISVELIP